MDYLHNKTDDWYSETIIRHTEGRLRTEDNIPDFFGITDYLDRRTITRVSIEPVDKKRHQHVRCQYKELKQISLNCDCGKKTVVILMNSEKNKFKHYCIECYKLKNSSLKRGNRLNLRWSSIISKMLTRQKKMEIKNKEPEIDELQRELKNTDIEIEKIDLEIGKVRLNVESGDS